MDVSMPKMDGIEATKRLKQYDETIKVLILSSFQSKIMLYQHLKLEQMVIN